jgi:hypothetical protein
LPTMHGGPPPKYQPRFTEAEVAQAQAWATSQTLPHAEMQRARLVLLLHEQPDLRSLDAGRRLRQSASWVCKWRRRWVERGFSLQDTPHRGRPQQFADWVLALVIAIACELPSQRSGSQPALRQQCLGSCARRGWSSACARCSASWPATTSSPLEPWRYVSWMHPRDPNITYQVTDAERSPGSSSLESTPGTSGVEPVGSGAVRDSLGPAGRDAHLAHEPRARSTSQRADPSSPSFGDVNFDWESCEDWRFPAIRRW